VNIVNLEEIERFAKEHPQSECYKSKIPGVKLLHESRLNAILHLISKVVNLLTDRNDRLKLIDIGCGEGYVLKAIIKSFPSFDLVGIDISETRLRRAKESLKSLPNVDFVRADAQKMPFRSGSFNIAVCTEVIEHVPNDVLLLWEIHRVLDKGFLILTTPNLYTFETIFQKFVLRKEVKISIPDHLREYSWRELELKVRKAGFSILSFSSIGFYIPCKTLFFRSRLLTRMLFSFQRLFPKLGRVFVILAKTT